MVWGSTYKTGLEKLICKEKEAIRIVSKSAYRAHTKTIFYDYKLLFQLLTFIKPDKQSYLYLSTSMNSYRFLFSNISNKLQFCMIMTLGQQYIILNHMHEQTYVNKL